MKTRVRLTAPLCLFVTAITLTPATYVLAQHEAGESQGPSKYLFVDNVELKTNQDALYAKTQGEQVKAMRDAKAPSHFIGMWAITGANHVLYLHGFDSFADLQKNHEATYAMPKLIDQLNAGSSAQSAATANSTSSIYRFDKDLSLNTNLDLSKMRFMRIILFHVKNGHGDDFERVAKLFVKAYQTAIPDAHWAMFEKMYGVGSNSVYILVTPMESLGVVDGMLGSNKQFMDKVGEEQVQTLYGSMNAALDSYESDLFAFDPQLSYPPDSWLTSSPDFWGKK